MTMASSRLDMPSTMTVLDTNSSPVQSNGDEMGDGLNRRSRSSVSSKMSDLDPDAVRRTPTPSKQVSLTSVRRKEDISADLEKRSDTPKTDSSKRLNGFYGDVHAVATKLNQPVSTRESVAPDQSLKDHSTESNEHGTSNQKDVGVIKGVNEDINGGSSAVDDDDSDEDNTAPSQLLMEFLGCVMEEDYENAQKLCKMILLYEPDHPEALKFQPLIEEKLKQEEEEGSEDSEDESSSEDEEEEEDSSDDSDQSSSEEEDDQKETDQSKEEG